jgi:hypothetical protein
MEARMAVQPKPAPANEAATEPQAQVPGSLRDPGAVRFWFAVLLTGFAAGIGAALLTSLLKEVQWLAWGVSEPTALLEAARRASAWRHLGLLLAAGLLTGAGQLLLTRLSSGNGIDITTAIWFQAGRLPTVRTLGSAVLSIVIVGMGAALGREGAPKQAGAVFGNLASDLQKLSDEQRRLLVAIGAGAGMAAVYSVPLGGAIFSLEVLRGALALRLVLPALAATMIATEVATFVVPNAPIYATQAYSITPGVLVFAVLASPFIGLWSVGFVRAIAWADRARPSGWRRLVAPSLVFLIVGAVSIPYPEVLGNGQDVAQLLFKGPMPAADAPDPAAGPAACNGGVVRQRRAGRPLHPFARRRRAGRQRARHALALARPGRRHRRFRAARGRRNAGGHHAGADLGAGFDDGAHRPGSRIRPSDASRHRRRDIDRPQHRNALDL